MQICGDGYLGGHHLHLAPQIGGPGRGLFGTFGGPEERIGCVSGQ